MYDSPSPGLLASLAGRRSSTARSCRYEKESGESRIERIHLPAPGHP